MEVFFEWLACCCNQDTLPIIEFPVQRASAPQSLLASIIYLQFSRLPRMPNAFHAAVTEICVSEEEYFPQRNSRGVMKSRLVKISVISFRHEKPSAVRVIQSLLSTKSTELITYTNVS